MYFDSHAHLDDARFEADFDEILAHMRENGVTAMMNIGCDLPSSENSVRLAQTYDWIWAAVGSHPDDADHVDAARIEVYRALCKSPRVQAIGEIGLDYHYEGYDRDVQIRLFREQLDLAKQLDLPVIIHARDCTEDYVNILREMRPRGVVHCFSGSAETAREVLKLGMYIGFTGVLTFKNAKKALKALAEVPEDKLVLETDCPYMAPVPFRGKRCDSRMIPYTAEAAALVRGTDTQTILEQTCRNGERLFNI